MAVLLGNTETLGMPVAPSFSGRIFDPQTMHIIVFADKKSVALSWKKPILMPTSLKTSFLSGRNFCTCMSI